MSGPFSQKQSVNLSKISKIETDPVERIFCLEGLGPLELQIDGAEQQELRIRLHCRSGIKNLVVGVIVC